jgi:hypothetical protein
VLRTGDVNTAVGEGVPIFFLSDRVLVTCRIGTDGDTKWMRICDVGMVSRDVEVLGERKVTWLPVTMFC